MDDLTEMLRGLSRAALPELEGQVRVPGLRAPVEVIRDRWGVPHICASSLRDLFFAQGFVAASDRLFQIEMFLRVATGRLSEILGGLTLGIDRFVRTLGWNRMGRLRAESWDEQSHEMASTFSAGLRAWLEHMPAPPVEYAVLEQEPWMPDESEEAAVMASAAVLMAYSLSGNWDAELLRAEIAQRLGPEAMRDLFPDLPPEPAAVLAARDPHPSRLAVLRGAALPPPEGARGQGSNNWVVAGRRSVTGLPLLANDPHLAIALPSSWYECHLSAPGLEVSGVALPFHPGVLVGHNERIAWGFTVAYGDLQDLYLERLSEDGRRAEYLGRWEPVTVHREELRVRDGAPVTLEVAETRHGPVLDSYLVGIADPLVIEGGIRSSYALRWDAARSVAEPSAILALNRAGGWEELRAAVAGWGSPGLNLVYADAEGNIGYQLVGRYPLRRAGDGAFPAPGWTDEYEWVGEVPFEELPRAFNPEEGFLCTANNRPYGEDYPYRLGRDFTPPFRARRIAQLLTSRERHSAESFAAMQMDTLSLAAAEVLPHLLGLRPESERQARALALLAGWDGDLHPDSAAAAIYQAWCVHIARRVLIPLLGEELYRHFHGRRQWTNAFQYQVLPGLLAYPTARWFGGDGPAPRDRLLREALEAALDDLARRLGTDLSAWRWGAVHRARVASRLALLPGLDVVLTAGVVEMGGDEQTICATLFEPELGYEASMIPSWRQILDPSDWDASVGVLPGGQSENPASPHFADQLELWRQGRHHPLPFSRAAVEEAAEARFSLVPPPDA
jgi:penicillin amidase